MYKTANYLWVVILVSLMVFNGSCRSSGKLQSPPIELPDEIIGVFEDDYGSSYIVNNLTWQHGKSNIYHLIMFNEDEQFIIARNDDNNPTDGGLFSKIDIIYFSDMEPWRWGYCLTKYDAPTIQEAIAMQAADRTSPLIGCNSFPFTRMKLGSINEQNGSY